METFLICIIIGGITHILGYVRGYSHCKQDLTNTFEVLNEKNRKG